MIIYTCMKTYLLNKILNINSGEWSRVGTSWTITFLSKISFVIGWTMLVALYLKHGGITSLPFLFILNGILTMTGIYVYAGIIQRMSKEKIMILTCLTIIMLLFSTNFSQGYQWIIIATILVCQSMLLGQLNVQIALFVEDMFSPLESERAFPIVESAQTIGGICGGLILALLAKHIGINSFIHIWIIVISCMIIAIVIFQSHKKKLPFLKFKKRPAQEKSNLDRIKQSINTVKYNSFLKGLAVVILLQWVFINLLEFQFTKSIHQTVTNTQENTIVFENTGGLLQASLLENPSSSSGSPVKTQQINQQISYEQMIAFDLGSLHMIFNMATLFIQLFLASRVIKSFGIVNTMIINPVVNFISMIGLTLHFSMISAVTAKTGHEATHTLFQSAYYTSYYGLKEHENKQMKELLETAVKPIGAILGMLLVLLLQMFSLGNTVTLNINLLMMATMLITTGMLFKMRKSYMHMAKRLFESTKDNLEQKIASIEILCQKGLEKGRELLSEALQSSQEDKTIKIKILKEFGELEDYKALPDILDYVEHDDQDIKQAAIESLGKFKNLNRKVFSHAFSKYRIITTLKQLFEKENSEEIRAAIIKSLAHLDENQIGEFLINIIKTTRNHKVRADCIYLCKLFNDPSIAYYIRPYLKSRHIRTKAHTITILWKTRKYRNALEKEIHTLMKSESPKVKGWVCYLIGETNPKKQILYLQNQLKIPRKTVQRQAALALAKNRDPHGIEKLAELLLDSDSKFSKKTFQTLDTLKEDVQESLTRLLQHKASIEINKILSSFAHHTHIEDFPLEVLKTLQSLYSRAQADIEACRIQRIIQEKTQSPKFNNSDK